MAANIMTDVDARITRARKHPDRADLRTNRKHREQGISVLAWDGMAKAEKRFSAWPLSHSGHCGRSSPKIRSSKACPQSRQVYSKIGTARFYPLARARVEAVLSLTFPNSTVPPEHSREVCARIAGARLVILPRTGHLAFAEAPEEFRAVLLELLEPHGDMR